MQLNHSFTVPVEIAQAWELLRDIESAAPCMPGATIESVDGDEVAGRFKMKIGQMQVTYQGRVSLTEVDEDNHRATIEAEGKEARGDGTAKATIIAELVARDDQTEVTVLTDLAIVGRPEEVGRGVMSDAVEKVLGEFAQCVAQRVAETSEQVPERIPEEPAVVAGTESPKPPPAAAQPPEVTPAFARMNVESPGRQEPIDLFAAAGPSVLKRLAWGMAGLLLLWLLVRLVRRR